MRKETNICVKWDDFKKNKIKKGDAPGSAHSSKSAKVYVDLKSVTHGCKRGQNRVPVYNSDIDSFMQVKVGSPLKLSQSQTE